MSVHTRRVLSLWQVPCTGLTKAGQRYNLATACRPVEYYAIMEFAENYTRNVLRMTISSTVKRRIALLPTGSSCPWTGLATLGCSGKT